MCIRVLTHVRRVQKLVIPRYFLYVLTGLKECSMDDIDTCEGRVSTLAVAGMFEPVEFCLCLVLCTILKTGFKSDEESYLGECECLMMLTIRQCCLQYEKVWCDFHLRRVVIYRSQINWC